MSSNNIQYRLAVQHAVAFQVITEDSDMLAYGCPTVLFKMDKTGAGQEICLARLPEARNPSFVGFSRDMFLEGEHWSLQLTIAKARLKARPALPCDEWALPCAPL